MKNLWIPIQEKANLWLETDTSSLDSLRPAWENRRKVLIAKHQTAYQEFNEQLKRAHAIETGIIERLYDVSRGVTETLITEGFHSSIVSHGESNISANQLITVLNDQIEALDYAFSFINTDRPLTQASIRELQEIVTKNQGQIEVEVLVDGKRQLQKTDLLKGQYKIHPNNPRRTDGIIVQYCPPEEVEIEMQNLVSIYNEWIEKKVHPAILASWLHHVFTTIHPFQDGNGRVARILTSLALIKGNLFPFTVNRDQKSKYIDALEKADDGDVQHLVSFLCNQQRSLIDQALNFDPESIKELDEVSYAKDQAMALANVLGKKVKSNEQMKQQKIDLFNQLFNNIKIQVDNLNKMTSSDNFKIKLFRTGFNEENSNRYSNRIHKIAEKYGYVLRKTDESSWITLQLWINSILYADLVFTLHPFGYEPTALKLASFALWNQSENEDTKNNTYLEILDLQPLTLSIQVLANKRTTEIQTYIDSAIGIALYKIRQDFE